MQLPPWPRSAFLACGLLALGLIAALTVLASRSSDPFADKARVEAAVGQALRANPALVVEALQAMQQRQGEMEQLRSREAVAANRQALEQDGNAPVAGNRRGDVTVVQFFDYRCPYCRQAMATVDVLLRADPNLRLVYKEFPILGPESLIAARAAVAARDSALYPALHAALMTAPSPLTEDAVLKIAAGVGLEPSALKVDMQRPEIEQILAANHALANQIGITGTPAFVIGDRLVSGVMELDEMKEAIAALRARQP